MTTPSDSERERYADWALEYFANSHSVDTRDVAWDAWQARAALDRPAVPREPTEAMLEAGKAAFLASLSPLQAAWRAMYDAAQRGGDGK